MQSERGVPRVSCLRPHGGHKNEMGKSGFASHRACAEPLSSCTQSSVEHCVQLRSSIACAGFVSCNALFDSPPIHSASPVDALDEAMCGEALRIALHYSKNCVAPSHGVRGAEL